MSFGKFLPLMLAAAPLALIQPVLAQAPTGPAPGITTQLPRGAAPSHYAIEVTPDAANLKFTGKVTIDVAVAQSMPVLVLNAADLTIGDVRLTPTKGKSLTGTAKIDADAQTVTLDFGKPLAPGSYKLDVAYAGVINTQANGLFALDYTDNEGKAKRALFTQFEAPDARRFVPSFDEPSYKATFGLSAIVPTGQLAVSNMPVKASQDLGGGKTRVTFGASPKMSSYLLFFGLGDLERATKMAGATEVGVITGKGNTGKAQLALDASVAILPWFNDYFGVPYPLPKLDNVAGPGQSQFFSAMENWGAIFTFERALLVDPRFTSEGTRRTIYSIVAHEMAHQWFGDLVTMAWWDDLWLNEGFASWMATKVTDKLQPEWEMLLTRVGGRERAMALDALATTHPVVQKINTVEEVNQAFDDITYEKGEAVITMLEGFAGEDVWREGIRSYMKAHAYGNTVTDDLWKAVEGAGAKGLVSIAHDFTSQPGIPLVKVDSAQCKGGSTVLALSQGEFSRDRKDKTPLRWNVPVMAQTIGGAPQRLILNGAASLTLPGCGAYVINAGQTGYYRSLYPQANVQALAKGFTRLSAMDQIGLLADNFQLGLGGYQPIGLALDMVDAVPASASPAVLAEVPDYLGSAYHMLESDKAAQGRVAAYASRKLGPVLAGVGFDAKAGEGPQAPVLRSALVATLGGMGDRAVVAEAARRFAEPALLDGPLRNVWLRIIAQNADAATWEKLRAMANGAKTDLEKSTLFALLGAAKDEALATKALDLAMTDEPGKTTSAAIISAVGAEHPMLAVDYVLAHRQQYEAMIDVSARSQAIARLGGGSADPAMATKLDAYASQHLTPESRKVVDRSISAIKTRIETRARLKPALLAWFAKK
ncbi:Aminopeptidase N [Sphingobium herbicidovorans NBRC 16415]|uniref:Aminopeptidase n=1 Tax=Sphingobium herbicidovorans (strain ATCC 700291 / DSM 11019 / CCUG 56400 / KCTC 2939 / LMG 18315 / NBRC 16415 / MH) TaxID=1219045 RepID=A0A086PA16_SPHHM|nr:M1 family metallopeptidase [Sphingobium herbicidovorans]KFG90234.1 Aminopeptidase N [Sphingobium herbicidovorans NBRC 16415]